ncbi:diacylglycerol kinase family lipid kinase [uncultured Ruminococcus sp.]|uniref:diacylglycerol/lipid kinase family protein n=1 Tax=uncultured Ruminococcus sp. TaxID=165186 RepID=UPI00292D85DB|nr:diacylglycerol kinase family lipid kinase [uncultured Ruminococcus sp.]
MTHLFILNAFAGIVDATPEIKAQIEALQMPNAVIEYTQKAGDAEHIARRYAEQGDELRVYACGGDGTANEALHGILGFENAALGVIPVGTGNDYVRSLPGETKDFLDIAKMVHGATIRVDLLKCGDRYALNVVSVGYDCEVADRAQKNKRLPMMSAVLAYRLAIVQCLLTKRKHTFTPYADGKMIPIAKGFKSQMLAVAAKGKYYGGGIKATPYAALDDGLIDFMAIPTVPISYFAWMFGAFTRGEHIDHPKGKTFIQHQKCKTLKIDNHGAIKVSIDGEMFVMQDPEITVVPNALDVIIPVKN